MTTIHEWEADGKRFRAVYDDTHETRGSYAYDSEAETKAAEDEELRKLESGEWIVIGILVSEKQAHCPTCKCRPKDHPWTETDSLWGIVVDNSTKAIETFARDCM